MRFLSKARLISSIALAFGGFAAMQGQAAPMAPVAPDYHSSGVDHSEFPGDMDHDPNR